MKGMKAKLRVRMFMPQRISIDRARRVPSNLDAFRHRPVARRVARAGDSTGREEPVAPRVPAVARRNDNSPEPELEAVRTNGLRRWELGLVLELGVDHVRVLAATGRWRRAATTTAGVTTGLLVLRLGERVRRGLQGLEALTELVGLGRFLVPLEHAFGVLQRFLDLELLRVAELRIVLLDELLRPVDQRVELVASLDRLLARLVLGLVLGGIVDRLLDVGLRQTRRRLDLDRLLRARGLVLRGDVDDAVRIDVERHFDLRHAARRRRDAGQLELAERLVVLRHRAFALGDVNFDGRLVIRGGRERLALARRDRRVARDQRGGDTTERLDRERQRRDVEQEDVLDVAREDAALSRCTERDDLVGVDRLGRLATEELLHLRLDERDARRATDEDDLVDVRDLLAGIGERLLAGLHRAGNDVLDHLLELRARQLLQEVLRPGRVGGQVREVDLRLLDVRQLDLGLLRRLLQALEHHLVFRHVDAGVLLELGDEPIHDAVIDVVAAEVRVAVRRDDLDDLVTDLEDGDIERATAHVEHGDELLLGLVETVRERGRGRLVDAALDVETGDLARVLRRLALRVVEVRRDGDDRFGHRLAQILLGRTLQLHQHARPDLRRRVALAADLEGRIAVRGRDDLERDALGLFLRVSVGELPTDETLAREHGVLGGGDCLTASDVTYEDFALLVESDHRRGQARALLVCDDLRLLALHDRDHGVRGAKVDADDLALVCFFL